jgi:predicted DNA-binding transcriptional regulator AlpA
MDLTVGEFIAVLQKHPVNSFQPETKPAYATRKVQLKTLASIYGWGRSSIYKWCKQKAIPHSRVQGEYRFDLDLIEKWIEEKKVATKQEIIEGFENKKRSLKITR